MEAGLDLRRISEAAPQGKHAEHMKQMHQHVFDSLYKAEKGSRTQVGLEELAGVRRGAGGDIFRCARNHNLAAGVAPFRSEVDHVARKFVRIVEHNRSVQAASK